MKFVAAVILTAFVVWALPTPGLGQSAGIKVIVNGVDVPLIAPAVMSNGQVMAPISGLFEPMGAIAAFYEVDRSIVVTNRLRATVRMRLGETTFQVNAQSRVLPVAPQLVNGLVFVPAQVIFSALGAWTKFEEAERTLYVSSQITGVAAQVRDGILQVKVSTTGPVQTETNVLSNPDRLVVDFMHAALRTQVRELPVQNAGVHRIRTAQFQIKPYISRMVFDLTSPVEIRVTSDPATYLVTLEISPKLAESGSPPPPATDTPAVSGALKVMGVTFEPNGPAGRVVIDATGGMEYKIREFVFPDRLAIDIARAVFIPVKQELAFEHPSVLTVRAAQFTAQPPVTRIVVTLKRKMNYVISQSGGQLIIDINAQMVGRGHLVAIDPGHGGRDPGAIGPGGLRESDIVLDIALRVRDLLRQDGIRVMMIRETDVTVELLDRPGLAREAGATIYVSIHANANGRATVNGSETYYLTPQSLALAQMIQDELGVVLGLPSRGIKTASFLVLRDSGIPSVLVETAFISNADEEARLSDMGFRQRLSRAIHRGITRFLAIYPAPVAP
jgi:N-acetylmuramoyl-L-alanine amidase